MAHRIVSQSSAFGELRSRTRTSVGKGAQLGLIIHCSPALDARTSSRQVALASMTPPTRVVVEADRRALLVHEAPRRRQRADVDSRRRPRRRFAPSAASKWPFGACAQPAPAKAATATAATAAKIAQAHDR